MRTRLDHLPLDAIESGHGADKRSQAKLQDCSRKA